MAETRAASRAFGWPHAIQLWIAWVVATLAGGLLEVLALVCASALTSGLTQSQDRNPNAIWLASIVFLAGFFVAPALSALPQAVLLGRSAVLGRRSGRALAWMAASALGGLLFVGYLMYDNTSQPTWSDVLGWYGFVTEIVALVVVGAQAMTLRRVVPLPRLLVFVLLTVAGWIVGWSLFVVHGMGAPAGNEGNGWWGTVVPYLWFAAPFALIGACSGLVLAPLLSAGVRGGVPVEAPSADR